jgi:protein-tyrosine-phosphatase
MWIQWVSHAGEIDPFAVEAMEEIGIEIGKHRPKRFDDLEDASFDLVVTLSPEAHHRAMELTRGRRWRWNTGRPWT